MIVESSKDNETQNPLREGINAEANLNTEFPSSLPVFPSPYIQPPDSNEGPSSTLYPASSHAPPAYTDGETPGGSSALANEKGLAPGHSRAIQHQTMGTGSSYPYAVLSSPLPPTASHFSRQAPQQPYPSFEPIFLIATGQYLTRGFPPVPPPSRATPHPFASHDVTEFDWLGFLQGVKTAGELTEKQEQWARLPIVSILPIVGSVSTHIIRQQMKKGKHRDVANVIDTWNHHFFHPRDIEVVLMQGVTRLSGVDKHSQNEPTMGWSGESLIQRRTDSDSTSKGKGKAKEEEDTTYRLYIRPLPSRT